MSASKIVATVTPVAGFYNVTATGTLDSHGDIMRCSVAAMSSRGAFKSKTPLGDAEGGATTAETGVVSVRTGSAIVEICGGVSLEGGEFFPATMHNPTLTAIGVTHASGTVNLGPLRSATHKSVGGHPVNTFTNQAKPLPQR
jgi:hypothetical protein